MLHPGSVSQRISLSFLIVSRKHFFHNTRTRIWVEHLAEASESRHQEIVVVLIMYTTTTQSVSNTLFLKHRPQTAIRKSSRQDSHHRVREFLSLLILFPSKGERKIYVLHRFTPHQCFHRHRAVRKLQPCRVYRLTEKGEALFEESDSFGSVFRGWEAGNMKSNVLGVVLDEVGCVVRVEGLQVGVEFLFHLSVGHG